MKIKRICGPPKTRRGRPRHIQVISAILTAFFAASVFAYAGGIGATVDSFVAKLMTKFSGILLDICDMLVSPIFSITTMTVSQIAAYIPGFNTTGGSGAFFVEGIQMLGTCLAGCLAMLGILKIIIGLARDEKVGSVGSLIWRMFIFIPLTIFGRKLLQGLFDQVITPISSAFASGILSFSNNAVFSTAAAPLTGNASQLATLIVGTVLMVMIGYNLIGLVLEAAERYLICIVIIFLSPLALATGVSEESSMIAKNWLKMFWSHGVLLILNIWVVGIGRSCFDTLDPSATTTQIIVWALITYAYFKVAQKLDDMMQNSGMMITRTGGDFVHDATLAVGTIAATGKHLFGGAADTVVAGAGVANAIKSGGGIGDVAKPIASYVKSHPILAPTAGAAATVAGGTAGFAAQVGAAHSLSHTSDESRAASVASGKIPKLNTPAYRAAAQNILNQNGFAPAKGGRVDNLSVNPDGSLGGVVTQRDATGRVQSQSAFTMSNKAGTGDGFTVSAGRQMTVGADGKSATIIDPQAGTFELTQAGTDKYGNQIWQATRTADAGGTALTEENAGTSATLGFNVKPDARSNDGIGAQAANAFMSGGSMEQLTQQSDDALAHHAQMEADKSAAWNDLNSMSNDDRVAQMRDENSTVDYGSAGYRAATAEYMQQNGLDDGMVERGGEIVAQQVTEDGRLVGCMAVRDADGNVLEEKFYALSTKAPEPDATASDTGSAPQQGQYAQSVGAEPAAEMADTGTAGTAEAPAMEPDTRYTEPGHANTDIHIDGETVRATTATLDEVLTAKYQMFDEGHGVVETSVPFPVSWTVKMKKKQKETQDILSYHSQAAGCSDKARAKASGGRQPIEECGRTGL